MSNQSNNKLKDVSHTVNIDKSGNDCNYVDNEDKLWSYYNSLSDYEKNKVVSFINENKSNKDENSIITYKVVSNILLVSLNILKEIGNVVLLIMLPLFLFDMVTGYYGSTESGDVVEHDSDKTEKLN